MNGTRDIITTNMNTNAIAKMKWLAIDTSTGSLTIGLLENGHTVAQFSSAAERNHSILLMPAIERLLHENGTKPAELNGIAVGRGPGSYTGVRIAVSVAKTMAWALRIPVISVSGLEAMALGAWKAGGAAEQQGLQWFVPLLDARRKQAFTAIYALQGEQRATVVADGIRLVPDWVERIDQLADEQSVLPDNIVFIGETAGFQPYMETLTARYPERVRAMPFNIAADSIGELAWERWLRGEQDDVHGLIPNYTQLAEAETKLLEKEKQGGDSCG
jgi:tRNA threonylcarbamoyladenosine biosynthesis protein TsaB